MTASPTHRLSAESESRPVLNGGQNVIFVRGPLAGLEGMLVDFKGESRVVVSVTLLQRSVTAEVDTDWVRPDTERFALGVKP